MIWTNLNLIHNFSAHFPIALILIFTALKWLSFFDRYSLSEPIEKLFSHLTIAFSLFSISIGLVAFVTINDPTATLTWHYLSAIAATILFFASELKSEKTKQSLFLVSLSAVTILISGYWGGHINHDHHTPVIGEAKTDVITLEQIVYEDNIKEIFNKHCTSCHHASSGIADLSSFEGVLKGDQHGPLIIPAERMRSRLYLSLVKSIHNKGHMPKNKPRIPNEDIRAIGVWIDAFNYDLDGNKITYKNELNWSFKSFSQPDPPDVENLEWNQNPIDKFVYSLMKAQNLTPKGLASAHKRKRRLHYKVLGLPPKNREFDAKHGSASHQIYASKLLDSTQFGENLASMWLDLTAYADSNGFENDFDSPGNFYFRDYVIRSFNADLGFNKFLQQQLAGDLIDRTSKDYLTATGYLLSGPFFTYGRDNQKKYIRMDDILTKTFQATLGLSLKCARCHDHKSEPISQMNYYSWLTPFNNIKQNYIDPGDYVSRHKKLKKNYRRMGMSLMERRYQEVQLSKKLKPLPYASTFVEPSGTYVLNDGTDLSLGALVPFELPKLYEDTNTSVQFWEKKLKEQNINYQKRSIFAHWLTDTEDGAGLFVARVLVNYVWHHYFGQSLTDEPGNFGSKSKQPKHMALLNWLAYDFVKHDWSVKHLSKLILTSRTFNLNAAPLTSSSDTFAYYSAWKPHPLSAEMVRDGLLDAVGTLNPKMYGFPVMWPINPSILRIFRAPDRRENEDIYRPEMNRRSIYLYTKRNYVYPFFKGFNFPDRYTTTPYRSQSTNLEQLLQLMDSPFSEKVAQLFAEKISSSRKNLKSKIVELYNLVLSRDPGANEIETALKIQNEMELSDNEVLKLSLLPILTSSEFLQVD